MDVSNVLQRCFHAERPNQKWVTDITEFKVGVEKLYLSPVMGLYNGEIVAYEMQRRPYFLLVGNMLRKALAKLSDKQRPIVHADQGWHYQMAMYRRMLTEYGLTQRQLPGQCRYGKLL